MSKLRILLVSNKCPPDFDGGYELRAFQLAQALRARGHHVDFVTSGYRASYRGEKKDPEWVHRIFRYSLPSDKSGLARQIDRLSMYFRAIRVASENAPALDHFLESRTYDVAYVFGLVRIGFATVQPLTQRGIPILWHAGDAHAVDRFSIWPKKFPGYDFLLSRTGGKWWAEEKTLNWDNVAVVSDFLRERFAASTLPIKRLIVISRGIDFPLATSFERTAPVPILFMAARLHPDKGMHHAITALGLVRRKRPELAWKLNIAGQSVTPGYREQLIAQAEREGIADRVAFLDRLPHHEVLSRMREATAFLFCSVWGEPFSSTIIESLACGTPLIGSDDGSILEVVEPNVSGLIYPKNDPTALAAHIEQVLDDPALRLRLAQGGIQVIESRYTMDRILDLTEKTLAEVAQTRPTPQPA